MNNLLKYCGLVDARMNASKKDSPVCTSFIFFNKQKDMKFDRLLPKSGILKFFRNVLFLTSNFWSQSIFNIYAQTHETYLIRLDSFFPFLMTNHVWMIWINHIDAQFVKFFIISRLKGGTRGYGLDHRGLLGSHQWFWSSRTFGVKFGLVLFTFCSLPSLTRAAVPYPSKAKFGFMTIIWHFQFTVRLSF